MNLARPLGVRSIHKNRLHSYILPANKQIKYISKWARMYEKFMFTVLLIIVKIRLKSPSEGNLLNM